MLCIAVVGKIVIWIVLSTQLGGITFILLSVLSGFRKFSLGSTYPVRFDSPFFRSLGQLGTFSAQYLYLAYQFRQIERSHRP